MMESFRRNSPLKGKGGCSETEALQVEQIVAVLKQAELGTPVADLIRHLGIAEQTFYR